MMEPMQCRAARALLAWTQEELATAAGVSGVTVRNFEGEITNPIPATLVVLQLAFEKAGVVFFDGDYSGRGGPGVRLRK
jgi:DNA-binding XRE family transcriptional regulator